MDSYAKNSGSMTSQAEHFRPYFSFLQGLIWPKKIPKPSGIKIKKTKNIYEIMTPCTIEFIELVQILRCSIANILFLL